MNLLSINRNLLTTACAIPAAVIAIALPSHALTLVDNTDGGTRLPLGSNVGLINEATGNSRVAISFTTLPNWRPYTQFGFKIPLVNGGTDPLTDLSLNIFAADSLGIPTGSALLPTQTYTSQVGRYGTFLAPFQSGSYNSFFIDTINPIFTANNRYAFVFSSTTPFSPSNFWSIAAVNPITSNDSSFATYLNARRTANGGITWLAGTATPAGFFLDGVPGPLPILGAGSAFAWSRRLRRRVNAGRRKQPSIS